MRYRLPLAMLLCLALAPASVGQEVSLAEKPTAEPHDEIDPALLLRGAAAWKNAPPEVQAAAVRLLREAVAKERGPLYASMEERIRAKQEVDREPIWDTVALIALAGPLLLLMPLFVFRRYPGRFRALCLSSALAAVLFSMTVVMFFLPLGLFLSLWEDYSIMFDPRLRILDASFDALDRDAESLLSRDLPVEQTLLELQDGSPNSFPTVLLDNLTEVSRQAQVFEPVVNLYRRAEWLFWSLPKVQCFIATLIFVLPMMPLFYAIVQLPMRAAAGEPKQARRIVRMTLKHWWREVATLLVMAVLFLGIGAVDDLALGLMAEPVTETVLRFIMTALDYLGRDPSPWFSVVYVSLAGVFLFCLLNVAMMGLAVLFYLTRATQIVRLRFHMKVPLRQYAEFWKWGTFYLLWVQMLPVVFVTVAFPVIHRVTHYFASGDSRSYVAALLVATALLLGGSVGLFWLGHGWRGLKYLVFLKVPAPHIGKDLAANPEPVAAAGG